MATEVILHLWMCSRSNCPFRPETTARGVLCCAFDIPMGLPEDRLEALRLDCCDNSSNSINYISCYWDAAADSRDRCGRGRFKKNKLLLYFLTSVILKTPKKLTPTLWSDKKLSRSTLIHIGIWVLLGSSNKSIQLLLVYSHQWLQLSEG